MKLSSEILYPERRRAALLRVANAAMFAAADSRVSIQGPAIEIMLLIDALNLAEQKAIPAQPKTKGSATVRAEEVWVGRK